MNIGAHYNQTIAKPITENNLYGLRNKLFMYNLDESLVAMKRSLMFIYSIAKQKKSCILIANTCADYDNIVKKIAISNSQNYVNSHWVGGMLTNWKQINKSVKAFSFFSSNFKTFLNNKSIRLPRYLKMFKYFRGVTNMKKLPDVVIVIDPLQSREVIHEAILLNIPVISFTGYNNSNFIGNTQGITYPIPVNNNSINFIYFYLNLVHKILKLNK